MNPDNIYSIEFDFIGFDQEELENHITFYDNGELPQLVNEENQLQTGGSELFQSNTKKIKGRGKAKFVQNPIITMFFEKLKSILNDSFCKQFQVNI